MTQRPKDLDTSRIVSDILQLKKYRHVSVPEDTVRDLVHAAARHYTREKDIVKYVRKRLHRIVAPYLGDPDYVAAGSELQAAFSSGSPTTVRDICARLMSTHASTRERLPFLDSFYARIFEVTGRPSAILDVACGLNPLSFPWMRLPTSTLYRAYDIHQPRIDFLNHYFALQGIQPLARVQDILVRFPEEEGDVAFLLKEVLRFERRQRGCSLPLFDALRVHYLVVSFPTSNLTGRRDLTAHDRQLFSGIIAGRPWHVTEIAFDNELVFCVDKR